jgi:quinol-cytochrome oxidoreductase complex cytochrome b subunit
MKKGLLPAIIVTVIGGIFIILYALGTIIGLIESNIPILLVLIVAIIFLIVLGMLVYTLVLRIKEIKGEDEDDISKY